MQNAHLRLGLLEYNRMTEKTSTRIRLRVDRYVGEGQQAHLISVFGNDSDALDALKALKNDLITVTTIQCEVTLSGTVSNDASSELAEWTVSHVREAWIPPQAGCLFQASPQRTCPAAGGFACAHHIQFALPQKLGR
jgi:hypothetical protein